MNAVKIAMIGNPNAGKTTLFNALTGLHQDVGNWPGVTVEKKSGQFRHDGLNVEVVDLPGTYALHGEVEGLSIDERIARDHARSGDADILLNVVDASNIERNLYLTTQLVELGEPVVVALAMIDVAQSWDVSIDADVLAERLGCPVVPVVATQRQGLDALRTALTTQARAPQAPQAQVTYAPPVEAAIETLLAARLEPTRSEAVRRLETAGAEGASTIGELDADADIAIASGRYAFVADLLRGAVRRGVGRERRISDVIDKVVLHRILGIPIFLAAMYALFMLTINVGGAFIDFFDILTGAVVVDGTARLLEAIGSPAVVVTLLADGVGGGLTTVATFIPIIGCLFLVLTFLEDSGYMARAAFVMDRFLRAIGLPGKAFVPMILGFGCTIPAVMATRTLDNARDRNIAIMMAPFMSCGARLPVYALFAAAFFPTGGQNLVFALYLIGILAAIMTGLVLRHTLLQGVTSPFVMELPPYRVPRVGALLRRTAERLWSFIEGAGRIIVVVVVVITFLNAWGTDGRFDAADSDRSVLAAIGQTITPAFAPMGLEEENWPATVGLFTGILAKEAVVGTLDALYTDLAAADAGIDETQAPYDLGASAREALATIPENLGLVAEGWADPAGVAVETFDDAATAAAANEVSEGTFGAMQVRFDGQVGAFAYLLLVLLYAPCLAAIGAIWREAGPAWAIFATLWTTGLGYVSAVAFYQAATFTRDPMASSLWLAAILATVVFAYLWLLRSGRASPAPARAA